MRLDEIFSPIWIRQISSRVSVNLDLFRFDEFILRLWPAVKQRHDFLAFYISTTDTHFSNETEQVHGPVARLSADARLVVYLVCLPWRDVTAWKNACPVGTRNYRSDTAAAAATSRKICFPFHSIARRVYFTADHHHHVGRINICQRYYDRATLHFLERPLSRTADPPTFY